MFAALVRDFRKAPITFILIAVSVALFFAAEYQQTRNKDVMSLGTLGRVVDLSFVGGEDVHGPFDLWSGPWWRWLRIPASSFHHGGILHLFFNASSLWFLGPLMERRLRKTAYLSFWFFAALIPMLPEYFMQHIPIGLSGVVCAMFGWCLVERRYDSAVAYRVHDGVVRNLWTCLIVCVVLTAANVLNIANLAHFAGVGYGWLNARAARARFGWLMWLGGHLLVPVAVFGVIYPIWIGRYHAFKGRQAAQENGLSAGVPFLQEAVRRDPTLPSIWVRLASERATQLDLVAAWKFAITGLDFNRSSNELENLARAIWRLIPADKQAEAMQELQKTFLSEADAWSKRLIAVAPNAKAQSSSPLIDMLPAEGEWESLQPSQSDEPSPTGRRGRKRKSPEINPDQDGSAVEGRTL